MPLPEGVPRVTVTSGKPITGPAGTPAQGKILFIGPPLVTVPGLDLVLDGYREAAVFDSSGVASIELVPGDLDTMSPHGWTYEVRSAFMDGSRQWTRYVRITADMVGTEVRFADVLVPDPDPGTYVVVTGPRGLPGAAGTDGQDGAPGASAYQVWLGLGHSGTEADFIASLKGPKGDAGGGGGVVPIPYISQIDAGIVVLTDNGSWLPVVGSNGTHVRRVVPNVRAGDIIQFTASFLAIGTVYFLDGRILKSDGSPSRYLSSVDDDLGLPGPEGYAPWYTQLSFKGVSGVRTFVVRDDEIAVDGSWTIEMVYMGTAITDNSNHLYWGNGYFGAWDAWHWPVGT